MKISRYFYKVFFKALIVCLISSIFIFYIFSLLGNLGENLSFTLILYLTFLNSFQILSYVPSFIALMTVILFIILLRSKNELVILREYLSINKIILIILPIVVIFGLVQLNSKMFSDKIEGIKLKLINSDDNIDTKVIINISDNLKKYTILKGVDIKKSTVQEFHKYEINNNKIVGGEYSNKIKIIDGLLVTNNYTKFINRKINNLQKNNIILNDFKKIFDQKLVVRENKITNNLSLDLISINKFFYFTLFFMCTFLILLGRKVIDQKKNLSLEIFICFLLLFYSILMNSIEVKIYNYEMQALSSLLILLIFLKLYKYE
tara:strand:+ start:963 stop:1919 length:957 start_codon:yes stop_codon:yes gene_type:complete